MVNMTRVVTTGGRDCGFHHRRRHLLALTSDSGCSGVTRFRNQQLCSLCVDRLSNRCHNAVRR